MSLSEFARAVTVPPVAVDDLPGRRGVERMATVMATSDLSQRVHWPRQAASHRCVAGETDRGQEDTLEGEDILWEEDHDGGRGQVRSTQDSVARPWSLQGVCAGEGKA